MARVAGNTPRRAALPRANEPGGGGSALRKFSSPAFGLVFAGPPPPDQWGLLTRARTRPRPRFLPPRAGAAARPSDYKVAANCERFFGRALPGSREEEDHGLRSARRDSDEEQLRAVRRDPVIQRRFLRGRGRRLGWGERGGRRKMFDEKLIHFLVVQGQSDLARVFKVIL